VCGVGSVAVSGVGGGSMFGGSAGVGGYLREREALSISSTAGNGSWGVTASGAQYGCPPHNLTRTERILRDNGSLGASPGVPASRTVDRFLTRTSGTVAGSVGPAVPGS